MSPSENYVIIQKVDGMREDLHIYTKRTTVSLV